jgi:hypothetical protein
VRLVEPTPPPITIVDPHASPAYTTELLAGGDEREPFQWTPRRRYVALTAVTVATLVAGVASAVDMVREGHRLDRASVTAVQLYADAAVEGSAPAAEVQLSLRNDGPTAVRLVSARLVAPGYGEQPLSDVLGAGESVVLHLPDQAPCGPALLAQPVETLRLQVRTDRAQVATREITLGPSAYIAVNHPARERCGYLPPDEAFSFGVQSMHRKGHEVVVKALVHDESVLPLTLVRVAAVPGLEVVVSPRLPLALPPQTGAQRKSHFVAVELHLRVANCSAFFSAPGLAFLADRGLVRGWVTHDASIWEVPIDMSEPEVGFSPVPDVFFELLQDGCPQLG